MTQRPQMDAKVQLFRLDASSVGGPVSYFCAGTLGGEPVSFGGQAYTPIDIAISDMEINSGGSLPTPTLKIGNSNSFIQAAINTYGDLAGCEIRRVRTFKRFLDGQPEEDGSAYIGPDVFRIERKAEETDEYVDWELSAAIDQEGMMLPGEVVLQDTCRMRYRRYDPTNSSAAPDGFVYGIVNPCPYTGANNFTVTGVPTTAANDRCGRQVSACKLRFGETAELPFDGFPGSARVQV